MTLPFAVTGIIGHNSDDNVKALIVPWEGAAASNPEMTAINVTALQNC